MKKLWILLALLAMSFFLTACFGGGKKAASSDTASSGTLSSTAVAKTESLSTTASPSTTESASVPTVVEPSGAPPAEADAITKDEALKIAKEKMQGDPGIVYMVVEDYPSQGDEGEPPLGEYYLIVGQVQNEGNWVDLDGVIYINKANGDAYFGGDTLEKLK